MTGRIFDKDGGFRDYKVNIRFLNLPPVATLTSTGIQSVGNPINFQFRNATDATPGDRTAGYTYSFDFENDGVFDQTGTSPTASRVFQVKGTYLVRGRITDRDGGFTDGLLTLVIK